MEKKINLFDLLSEVRNKKKAIPAFNVSSYDAMNAISRASSISDLPCIIQFSEKVLKRNEVIHLKKVFDFLKDFYRSKIYLHLDHCSNKEIIYECIDSGFDMVMFDGSSFPIDENISKTEEILKYAHSKNVCLEAEVGGIGGNEDGFKSHDNYAELKDIEKMCFKTDIDCLAVGFGNVHGTYKSKSCLNWDILEFAYKNSSVPLVLHGGTGLSDKEFKKAINFGCSKINLSTVLKKAYQESIESYLKNADFINDPSILHYSLDSRIFDIAMKYLKKFNE